MINPIMLKLKIIIYQYINLLLFFGIVYVFQFIFIKLHLLLKLLEFNLINLEMYIFFLKLLLVKFIL